MRNKIWSQGVKDLYLKGVLFLAAFKGYPKSEAVKYISENIMKVPRRTVGNWFADVYEDFDFIAGLSFADEDTKTKIAEGIETLASPEWPILLAQAPSCLMSDKDDVDKIVVEPDKQELNFYKTEVKKLKKDVSVMRKKNTKLAEEAELQNRLITTMIDTVESLPGVRVKDYEIVVLLLSDLHIGEKVSAEETGGMSHYSFEEFVRRLQHLNNKVLDITLNKMGGYDFERLEIHMLGDMISGIIHEELVDTSDSTVMEWLLNGAWVVAQFIMSFSREFREIVIPCVIGNHGRMSKKVRYKNRYVNWDYVFYHLLSMMTASQQNVRFIIPKSFYYVHEIYGTKVLMLHGDNINSWNGIPWYGIERARKNIGDMLQANEQMFNILELGHFHNVAQVDKPAGEMLINGGFKGGDEFSIGKMFTTSIPKQVIYGVHRDQGKTWSFNIRLDNYDRNMKIAYKWSPTLPVRGFGEEMLDQWADKK